MLCQPTPGLEHGRCSEDPSGGVRGGPPLCRSSREGSLRAALLDGGSDVPHMGDSASGLGRDCCRSTPDHLDGHLIRLTGLVLDECLVALLAGPESRQRGGGSSPGSPVDRPGYSPGPAWWSLCQRRTGAALTGGGGALPVQLVVERHEGRGKFLDGCCRAVSGQDKVRSRCGRVPAAELHQHADRHLDMRDQGGRSIRTNPAALHAVRVPPTGRERAWMTEISDCPVHIRFEQDVLVEVRRHGRRPTTRAARDPSGR